MLMALLHSSHIDSLLLGVYHRYRTLEADQSVERLLE